jgi:hypothetical protein
MKTTITLLTLLLAITLPDIYGSVTDNEDYLIVPAGETYTLCGEHSYKEYVLIEGTLYVGSYTGVAGTGILGLRASQITVSGTINGDGLGYRGSGNYQEGPGIGGYPGGGAGYGNTGGNYGGSSGGAGGPAYGTNNGDDIQMGSGGGDTSGGVYGGGNGGAVIILEGFSVTVSGTLTVNGSAGLNYTWGAGGGSGGGILIGGIDVNISGNLSAIGGKGGDGNWSGGGGAGGRIKVFYGRNLDTAGMSAVLTGGAGGTSGYFPGTAGGTGTYYQGQTVFDKDEILYVPAGLTYEMCGSHEYNGMVQIDGQVDVCPYNGTAGTGVLELISGEIIINGTINGDGRGYRGEQNYQEGPGCGGYPSCGGGYGGVGGLAGNTSGTGGISYGTQEHINIQMGSGGGDTTGGLYGGGNGGAAIILKTDFLWIPGTLTAKGQAGLNSYYGAGGGSGGGILLIANNALISGTISVSGGNGGGSGSSGAGGGGGGAGGRIKIFANLLEDSSATYQYRGGYGGKAALSGYPGASGTLFTGEFSIADLNHDGIVDTADFAIMAAHWLETL